MPAPVRHETGISRDGQLLVSNRRGRSALFRAQIAGRFPTAVMTAWSEGPAGREPSKSAIIMSACSTAFLVWARASLVRASEVLGTVPVRGQSTQTTARGNRRGEVNRPLGVDQPVTVLDVPTGQAHVNRRGIENRPHLGCTQSPVLREDQRGYPCDLGRGHRGTPRPPVVPARYARQDGIAWGYQFLFRPIVRERCKARVSRGRAHRDALAVPGREAD